MQPLRKRLDALLLDLAWSLWTELGVAGTFRNHQKCLIFFEELILLTVVLAELDPHFLYKKLSPTIASGHPVVITEPMIATGGTLDMAICLLKDIGVQEENIIVASVCTAPEGLLFLSQRHPKITVVMNVMDEKLNDIKYIVPGIGDFGDRYFGTTK